MALNGTLKDFGLVEILGLIGQQRKTGILHLTRGKQSVDVSFFEGKVVWVVEEPKPKAGTMADLISEAGEITPENLSQAMEARRRSLERLEIIVIRNQWADPTVVRDLLLLQARESLLSLFHWESGSFEFEACEVEAPTDGYLPLDPEHILLEGFQVVDEWPAIRRRLPSDEVTFTREKSPAALGPEGRRLGMKEKRVFSFIDEETTFKSLQVRSRLGEFETGKALVALVNVGCISIVLPDSVSEAGVGSQLVGGSLGRFAIWMLGTAILCTLCVLAAARLLGDGTLAAHLGRGGQHVARLSDPTVVGVLADWRISRIRFALHRYRLLHGKPAPRLTSLMVKGLLTEEDLHYPGRGRYRYLRNDTGYRLLPPLE